jgi:hypothetical protein
VLDDIENRKDHGDDKSSDLEFPKFPVDDSVPSVFQSSGERE